MFVKWQVSIQHFSTWDMLKTFKQIQFTKSGNGNGRTSKEIFPILAAMEKEKYHCVKSVCIWSYSGPHFPVFFRIQSECGKMRPE